MITGAVSLLMAVGTNLANGVPDCQAFCPQFFPGLSVPVSSWNVWLTCDGSPLYILNMCSYMLIQIIQFSALFYALGLFMWKASSKIPNCESVPTGEKAILNIFVGLLYAAGIACSILVEVRGWQMWHVFTALCFLLGFVSQGVFILEVLRLHGVCKCKKPDHEGKKD